MKIKINKGTAKGIVDAPASKSMAHRLLICASLAKGQSKVNSLAFSQDIKATIDCMSLMGANIKLDGDTATITGIDGKINGSNDYCCRESGSTLRFIIPILMLSDQKHSLTGYGRLMKRPMQVYEDIAKKAGIKYETKDDIITIEGKLKSDIYEIKGDISSQFISGLLFALPLLDGDSIIKILPPVESRSYIDLTLSAMRSFGIDINWHDETTIKISGNQQYKAQDMRVEGDYSNAAFLDFFAYFGGDVKVQNLNENTLQGDSVYRSYFAALDGGNPTLDVSNCPDLAPILMTLAAAKHGCTLKGTRRLKIKESDRGVVMAQELSKFGAVIDVFEDEIIVRSHCPLHTPNELLCGHNDHRVVMSMACLSTIYGGEVDEAEAVAKSFPDFFDYMIKLGFEVEKHDD
ncbi:MAG: 3-phosphoshikimate 1-carboxyvinyltransferase [Clostridia bacterium]